MILTIKGQDYSIESYELIDSLVDISIEEEFKDFYKTLNAEQRVGFRESLYKFIFMNDIYDILYMQNDIAVQDYFSARLD